MNLSLVGKTMETTGANLNKDKNITLRQSVKSSVDNFINIPVADPKDEDKPEEQLNFELTEQSIDEGFQEMSSLADEDKLNSVRRKKPLSE